MRLAEFDAFFKSEAHGVADLLVRGAEGNALVDEVSGGGHGIEIAGLRGFVHACAIELKGGGEAGHKREHLRNEVDAEGRLLRLLHVFIVGQRQAFELQRHCLRSAVNAADLGADQLSEVGIFLLRHGAGAGGKGLGQRDEVELRGGEKRDLFGETAQMQADKGERLQIFQNEVAVAGGVDGVGGGRGEAKLAARRWCGRARALRRPPRLSRAGSS